MPRAPVLPMLAADTTSDRRSRDGRVQGEADRRAAVDPRRDGEARGRRAGRRDVRPAGPRLPRRLRALPRARSRRGRAGGGLRRALWLVRAGRGGRARDPRPRLDRVGRAGDEATDRPGPGRRPHPRDRLHGGRRVRASGGLPPGGARVTAVAEARAQVVPAGGEPLWFLGTLARMKLTGEDTGGRFALWDGVLPRGAAPPLHSHPQDETFYVLEGDVTAWLVPPEAAERGPAAW